NGARGVIQDASDERLSVSANGAYIVGHDRPSSSPARWATIFGDKEVLTDEWWGTALSISGDGSVVVGEAYKTFESGPFIWRERGGFRMLRDLLENDYGMDLSEWPFFDSINRLIVTDAGNVVIGEGSPDAELEKYAVRNADGVGEHRGGLRCGRSQLGG